MKLIADNTKTSKGLTYLNLISIALLILFLILIPALSIVFTAISNRLIYWLTLVFLVLNCGFYIAPVHYKA